MFFLVYYLRILLQSTKGETMLTLDHIQYQVGENNTSKNIIEDISFSFLENTLYVITGQNGSGKSTLAKIIMGILPNTKGKIFLGKKDITKKSIQERVQLGLSFAFQQPVRFKGLTVKNLLDTASNHQYSIKELCEYLSMVGLCARDYIARPLDEKLSGGELKRIEIAMTLAQNKPIMIFDEPEAGIDLWSFDDLVKIFLTLKQQGKTIIIISHQEKILSIADQILVMQQGNIVAHGTPTEILPALSTSTKCIKLVEKGGNYGQN